MTKDDEKVLDLIRSEFEGNLVFLVGASPYSTSGATKNTYVVDGKLLSVNIKILPRFP